jgi:signal transduction histidine kinase
MSRSSVPLSHNERERIERDSLRQHTASGATVGAGGDSRLAAALIALARPATRNALFAELAHQLRLALDVHECAVALVEPGSDAATPRCIFRTPANGNSSTLGRLESAWRTCLRQRGSVMTPLATDDVRSPLTALTAPLMSAQGPIGTITAVLDQDVAEASGTQAALALIADHLAAGIERTGEMETHDERRRLQLEGQTAARIASQLRQPLFGIASAAQLLRFRAHEDPVLERNVGRILREVERLNGLTADLLELGADAPFTFADGDPEKIWDHVAVAHRGDLEARALTVRRTRAPVTARIDASRLGDAFSHLLALASSAAEPGTELFIDSSFRTGTGWHSELRGSADAAGIAALGDALELRRTAQPALTAAPVAVARRILVEHGGAFSGSMKDAAFALTLNLPARDPSAGETA